MSTALNRFKSAFSQEPYDPLTSADWDDRFTKTILMSAIVHTLVIFGIQFKPVNPALFENNNQPLDVVLVNAKSSTAPLKPDVLAQHDLDGGGTVEEERQAKSPLLASQQDQTLSATEEAQIRQQALEEKTKALMQQLKSNYAVPAQSPKAEADPRPTVPVPAPVDLVQRSLEMARLQARIDDQLDAYQKRPKRAQYGVSAKGYTFAQYVDDWRLKVERVGNLNYPEAARREGMYGNLKLEACIRPDGSLYEEEGNTPAIVSSSGSRVLDAAAMRIVRMSAPFPAFSSDMRTQMAKMNMEVFCITRGWEFTRSDRLTSQ